MLCAGRQQARLVIENWLPVFLVGMGVLYSVLLVQALANSVARCALASVWASLPHPDVSQSCAVKLVDDAGPA